MNEANKRWHDAKMRFFCETGEAPTRALIAWKLWHELIAPHIRYLQPVRAAEMTITRRTTFEGIEILRTDDVDDVLEFLK